MKFLALLYNEETLYREATPAQVAAVFEAHAAFSAAATEAGVMAGGEGLELSDAATLVRVRDGERMLTDGPFAETKEQLGGYYLLECKDLDEALEWAARIPEAKTGVVEVRPVMDYEAIEQAAAARESSA